jgi:endonuclease/exonuclease/phosphatase family metal-dependent hydrolase
MRDLVILQWNMGVYKPGKKAAVEDRLVLVLQELIREHQPDLIALQEVPYAKAEPILRGAGYDISSAKQRLATAWKLTSWGGSATVAINYNRALAVELTLQAPQTVGLRVLVCNVHLPSVLYGGRDSPLKDLSLLADEIREFRTRNLDAAEIILGDFNLEPHELDLRNDAMLHGNASLRYVKERESKRTPGSKSRHLYNPAWRLYGAAEDPHGTLYYSSAPKGGPWFVYDQAFFSSQLVSRPALFQLVDQVGGSSLLSAKVFQPNPKKGSDHLPIVWTVDPKL